jgi:hypothetical protein
LLQITGGFGFGLHAKPDVGETIVREYRRFLARCDQGRFCHFDDRNLRYLASSVDSGTIDDLRAPIRAYLAEANLARVHLTLVSESIQTTSHCSAPLATDIDAYHRAAAALRTDLLVRTLAGNGTVSEWNGVRCQLVERARNLRDLMARCLDTPGRQRS